MSQIQSTITANGNYPSNDGVPLIGKHLLKLQAPGGATVVIQAKAGLDEWIAVDSGSFTAATVSKIFDFGEFGATVRINVTAYAAEFDVQL